MEDPLVETWTIHDRINRYLLDAVPQEALGLALAARHRTVHQLFGHIHNVRLMWLKAAAPELMEGLAKVEGTDGDKQALASALEASGLAVAALLRKSLAAGGKVKGFKPHATAFLGYLIAHEAHHRGQIGWTLKGTGHPLPAKVAFGLWEWGVR
ncbi:MAG: DinB family protein [Isosphaeraceae bacterium]